MRRGEVLEVMNEFGYSKTDSSFLKMLSKKK